MQQTLPLAGVRVVTLAVNLPGPLAAARLRRLGADVVKVEPPGGDPLAGVAPGWYAELAYGQSVITLDLKDSGDRVRLDTELARGDILITAMRPAALARLGLDDTHLAFPGLSSIEIVGHAGAFAEAPGHDLTYQAVHGTLTPPVMPTVPIADLLGAEQAVSAAALALLERSVSGRGGRHRIVLEDAAAVAGAAIRHGLTGEGAPLGGGSPAYGIYATADGHVALAAIEPHFWSRTREALGGAGTRDGLGRVFATRTTAEWEALAKRADIPLAGIRQHTEKERL
ncbi:CoA transferase [Streptomyces albipurpureus]|uniref:CoA transferase n=1 Tax=Streptomyces albipurpureus TaxID=2897419 RepID=A0ABT0UYM0_9ACTN|nr:CoA transferase [Streptomyces sp. CWNU-1]MCM2393569.1 CoA transferase [Streptomyces sp. CWNU-1]